jgi:large-conductance mechanosensitive channel
MVSQAKAKVAAAKARAAEKARLAKDKRVVVSVNKQASGFADFIRNKGVVGLAIGLAIGTVASGTVKTIVEGFVTPVVQFLVGTHTHLEAQVWHVKLWGRTADFLWGAALSSLITLVATVFVIYVLFRVAKLDQLEKQDVGPLVPPKPPVGK